MAPRRPSARPLPRLWDVGPQPSRLSSASRTLGDGPCRPSRSQSVSPALPSPRWREAAGPGGAVSQAAVVAAGVAPGRAATCAAPRERTLVPARAQHVQTAADRRQLQPWEATPRAPRRLLRSVVSQAGAAPRTAERTGSGLTVCASPALCSPRPPGHRAAWRLQEPVPCASPGRVSWHRRPLDAQV